MCDRSVSATYLSWPRRSALQPRRSTLQPVLASALRNQACPSCATSPLTCLSCAAPAATQSQPQRYTQQPQPALASALHPLFCPGYSLGTLTPILSQPWQSPLACPNTEEIKNKHLKKIVHTNSIKIFGGMYSINLLFFSVQTQFFVLCKLCFE